MSFGAIASLVVCVMSWMMAANPGQYQPPNYFAAAMAWAFAGLAVVLTVRHQAKKRKWKPDSKKLQYTLGGIAAISAAAAIAAYVVPTSIDDSNTGERTMSLSGRTSGTLKGEPVWKSDGLVTFNSYPEGGTGASVNLIVDTVSDGFTVDARNRDGTGFSCWGNRRRGVFDREQFRKLSMDCNVFVSPSDFLNIESAEIRPGR